MATVTCPECHNEISDSAVICPSCGYPYAEKVKIYQKAVEQMQQASSEKEFLRVADMFHGTPGLFDSAALENACIEKASECKVNDENRAEEKRQQMETKKRALSEKLDKQKTLLKTNKKKIIGVVVAIALLIISIPVVTKILIPAFKYSKAVSLLEEGEYQEAETIFRELDTYKDSNELVSEAIYLHGKALYDSGEYESAIELFKSLGEYKDASSMIDNSLYAQAMSFYETGDYLEAIKILRTIKDVNLVGDTLNMARYEYANERLKQKDYDGALSYYKQCDKYGDTPKILDRVAKELVEQNEYEKALSYLYLHDENEEEIKQINYDYLTWQMQNHEYSQTAKTYKKIADYKDVDTNDMFVGAKLLAAGEISRTDTQMSGYIFITISSMSSEFQFTPDKLQYTFSGMTANMYSASDPVIINKEWTYYFDGCNLYYLNENGEYAYGGSFKNFVPPKGEDPGTVTVNMDLPEIMGYVDTEFEYEME